MGIQIINGGFLTTVQDMGRYGYQETGMSVSGVMDTRAASLANILVGNDTNEAVIEITMMGPTMKFTEDEIIAVTGGDLGAKIDGKPVERYSAVLVKAGQTLSFMACTAEAVRISLLRADLISRSLWEADPRTLNQRLADMREEN